MRWQVEVPGGAKVFLADLPLEVIGEAGRAHGVSWAAIIANPLIVDDRVVLDIYQACCGLAGVEPPERPTAQAVWDAFDLAEDDLPSNFVDGSPKAEADPTTD